MAQTAELPLLTLDLMAPPEIRFSYAQPGDVLWRKALIRSIEVLSGQPKLKRAYARWTATRPARENIFSAGVRLLRLIPSYDPQRLASIPASGPLLVVANHPYGVADGLIIGDLVSKVRPDFKIMTHSLLCQPPEFGPFMLPVDFGGSREARQRSAQTRREAMQWLQDGHCVVIFPAGGVATRQRVLSGRALDLPWHGFVGKLAGVTGTRVLPLHVSGENSTLFHLASHSWYPLRVALLFRETLRKAGKPVQVAIGDLISSDRLPHELGREAVARALKDATFELAGEDTKALSSDYVWPAHVAF
jgi:putative hemolysin